MKLHSTYIIYIVSVALFETTCRKTHATHPFSDVGDVQIILFCLQSFTFATNNFSQKVHFSKVMI